MEAQRLVRATPVNARELIYQTPGGDAPILLFDGPAELTLDRNYTMLPDGSFQLKHPPARKIRAVIRPAVRG